MRLGHEKLGSRRGRKEKDKQRTEVRAPFTYFRTNKESQTEQQDKLVEP